MESYDRHAGALGNLALLTIEDVELAKNAVVMTFVTLWRTPASIDLEEQSLRAALAGNVYTHCAHEREMRGGLDSKRKPAGAPSQQLKLTSFSRLALSGTYWAWFHSASMVTDRWRAGLTSARRSRLR